MGNRSITLQKLNLLFNNIEIICHILFGSSFEIISLSKSNYSAVFDLNHDLSNTWFPLHNVFIDKFTHFMDYHIQHFLFYQSK